MFTDLTLGSGLLVGGQYPDEHVNRSVVNVHGSQVDVSRNIRMIDERTAA